MIGGVKATVMNRSIAALLLLASPFAFAADAWRLDAPASLRALGVESPAADIAYPIVVDWNVLVADAGHVDIALPNRDRLRIILSEAEVRGADDYSWIGHVAGAPEQQVVITRVGPHLAGRIGLGNATYELRPSPAGNLLLEIDSSRFPQCGGALQPPPAPDFAGHLSLWKRQPLPLRRTAGADLPLGSDAVPAGASSTMPKGSVRIDVLIVVSTDAVTAAGSQTAAQAEATNAVALANVGFANSQMTPRFNLVGVRFPSYTSVDFNTDLDRLTNTADGFVDTVHTWRNETGADLVSMLTNRTEFCGLGWLMTSVSPSFATFGFQVTSRQCITNLSWHHEHGHNMGMAHDVNNSGGPGAYAYSYGWQNPTRLFRTVMAYNCPGGGCPRVNWFSNPNVNVSGAPTGTATANNALTGNNVASTVAAFRTVTDLVFRNGFDP